MRGGIIIYLALYRKYRPKSFEDVLSQPHITSILKNEVENSRTAHAYLFTGPRGTGKTTCSKILAMAVNCENPQEGNPCHQCENCRSIDEGSTLDVVEIDAASNNGVDNIRQLREEAVYTPVQCKYRVYIIDEAHMLSIGAFNALLKIMEEPPEHVKFILATTEAHKIPATILSRCQRFDFRRIKSEDIKENLLSIAEKENLSLESEAAELIARLADGGMRDALSIMDQCISFSDNITLKTVSAAAGVAAREYIFELTDCICSGDAATAVSIIDSLYSMSKDLNGLLEELITHFRNIMLTTALKHPEAQIVALPDEIEKIKKYSGMISLPTLLYCIDQMQECLEKMGRSFDKRLTMELCMIKLCTPSIQLDADAIASRLERLENIVNTQSYRPTEQPIAKDIPTPIAKEAVLPSPKADIAENAEFDKEEPTIEEDLAVNTAPSPQAEAASVESPLELDEERFVPLTQWQEVLNELKSGNSPLFGVLNGSSAFAKGRVLFLDAKNVMASTLIKQENNAVKLIDVIEQKTGVRFKLRMKAAPKPEADVNPLEALLNRARENGVEINEE